MAHYDLAIIGGGASGMAAAITAAEQSLANGLNLRISIYEKQERVGKKLLATGNGCCNLANSTLALEQYHGKDAAFAAPALSRHDLQDTLRFFHRLGLLTREEENGRLYPYSRQAAAVLDSLRFQAKALGVNTACGHSITQIQAAGNGFTLLGEAQGKAARFFAHKVILATGGQAAPKLGGGAQAYAPALALGHKTTPLFPALVQIKTENTFTKPLKGIKVEAKASLWQKNTLLVQDAGEVLFTEYGVSGPPIFTLSRTVSAHFAQKNSQPLLLALDCMPEYVQEILQKMLTERAELLPALTLENFLTGMLNKRLGQTLLKAAELLPLTRPAQSLQAKEIAKLSHSLKCFMLPVLGTLPWANAQVTAGGLATGHFCRDTLESKLAAGFYACGEVLDIDGDCGGYNLQWAWSSGRLAAESAVKSLLPPDFK